MFTVGSVADNPMQSINKRTPRSHLLGKLKPFLEHLCSVALDPLIMCLT